MTVLLIRADADAAIGTGHVMRCLALAQAWRKEKGPVVFAASRMDSSLRARIVSEEMRSELLGVACGGDEDAERTTRLAQELDAGWVVVDGYAFGYEYQRLLKNAGLRVLFFDDHGHARHYCADIVLNQNLHGDHSIYVRRDPQTHLLVGTRYALLRKEFWPWRDWRRVTPDVARQVLVTLGGSDEANVTLQVVRALQTTAMSDLEVLVVVGGANPNYDCLRRAVEDSAMKIRIERNVGDMAARMAWAELAISAGGSTSWELAFMGLPSLVIPLSRGEDEIAGCLAKNGVCVTMESCDCVNPDDTAAVFRSLALDFRRREQISRAGRHLVDGLGSERVLSVMESISSCA